MTATFNGGVSAGAVTKLTRGETQSRRDEAGAEV